VAKIEKPAALEKLDEILAATDGVMVARGDLGVETSLEQVPVWQKEILRRARRRGVFSITATQMLESMVESAVPTRAEVSDVANAVFDGTDALMLSAESAMGKHPVEAVQMLARIAKEVERGLPVRSPLHEGCGMDSFGVPGRESRAARSTHPLAGVQDPPREAIEAMVDATLALALRSEARCIACFTFTGRTGFLLARHRPRIGIVCLTPHEATRRRLTLAWNVRSLLLPEARTADEMMRRGLALLKAARIVQSRDTVVLVGGAANLPEATNLLRWVRV
jgi:pyruvate kinase